MATAAFSASSHYRHPDGSSGTPCSNTSRRQKPLTARRRSKRTGSAFESSPYSRLVRELLCALEIPYLLHNVGRTALADYVLPGIRTRLLPDLPAKGENRQALMDRAGKLMVPYLVDPNHGIEMFESAAIKDYLRTTYAQ